MKIILNMIKKGELELFTNYLNHNSALNDYINDFLLLATTHGHLHIVQFLHERGANLEYLNYRAHRLATINHHPEVAYYIAQQGAHFRQKNSRDTIIISLHLSKTAGTTLGNIISRAYPFDQQLSLWPLKLGPIGIGHVDDIMQHINTASLTLNNTSITGGHVPFGFHKALPKPAKYICTVREPIDRFLSGFFYSTGEHERNYLDDFKFFLTLSKDNIYDNYMTRVLSGIAEISWDLSAQENKRRVTKADYRKAIHNLEQNFELIGIVEHFDVYLMLLKQRFGWNLIEMVEKKLNITPFRKKAHEMPRRIINKLQKMNKYDAKLYQYAYERFCKAVEQAGSSLIADVLAFRKISLLCSQENHGDISAQCNEIIEASQQEAVQHSDPRVFFGLVDVKREDKHYLWKLFSRIRIF